ncbi:uncharacterized protein LODBEIA_P18260 [Lodderomyces beijingensis]|uniref:Leucine carboxyl methyltransferase 1 n=1 Tax=Lodderomyces beijingensis TaxID=1775926 RepID=A0ABP0ZHF4_9ASCO
MYSPQERNDKLVRATDLDALSCRHSINEKSYLAPKDDFIRDLIRSYESNLRWCESYTAMSAARTVRGAFKENKLPLINRGTFLRTVSVTEIISKFIKEFNGKCQLVSLGSGSDTRFFGLLKDYPSVVFHEIDFPESARIKKLGILNSQRLRRVVGVNEEMEPVAPVITSKEEFAAYDAEIHTSNYHLHGMDVREITADTPITGLDMTKPTLVISECVLCYLSPTEYEQTIKSWAARAKNVTGFVIYEPMSLNDQFGETMFHNLLARGLNLQTLKKYPSLESRYACMTELGLDNLHLTDLSKVGRYGHAADGSEKSIIPESEIKRINALEFIDEVEELKLLLSHYCLCYGETRSGDECPSFSSVNDWNW